MRRAIIENNLLALGQAGSPGEADCRYTQLYADDLGIYRHGKQRPDWILVSSKLEFVDWAVTADVVSDHWPVVAEIALRAPVSFNRTPFDDGRDSGINPSQTEITQNND